MPTERSPKIEWEVRYIDKFRERNLYTEERFNKKREALVVFAQKERLGEEPELWRVEHIKGERTSQGWVVTDAD